MISTTTRCAFINLASCGAEVKTVDVKDGFGGWDIHLTKPEDQILALSTGPLTGTGAPGSGAFTWCRGGSGKLELAFSEGRIGPACRFAQIDHLIFTNKSGKLWDLFIENGEITFSQAETGDSTAPEIFQKQNGLKPCADSVIVAFGTDGIVEDGLFCLGSAELSGLFRAKGVNSLTVTGDGKIEISDSTAFLDECVKLYKALAKDPPPITNEKAMARYLSVKACAGGFPDTVAGVAASLAGADWGKSLAEDATFEALAGLLRAYSGQKVTADMLGDSARLLMKEAKKLGKGA